MKKNNYLIKSLMSLLLFTAAGWASAQTYCASAANSTADSKCDRVQLLTSCRSIDNNTAADGCSAYTDFTNSVPSGILYLGGTYTINITQGTCGGAYGRVANAWIDYNNDGDFDDAGEMLGAGNTQSGLNGYVHSYTFTVPPGATMGNTRLRAIVAEEASITNPCITGSTLYSWGETEDYTVNITTVPGSVTSNFLVPTQIFTGTLVTFKNSNPNYIGHKWTINGTTQTTTDAAYQFPMAGVYNVKLVSENCLGKDSITKTIVVSDPVGPPVGDFVANKNVIELYESFSLIDLSTNGPTYWNWSFKNMATGDVIDADDGLSELRGGSPDFNKNPRVRTGVDALALGVGTWEVCLTTTNLGGANVSAPVCKVGYITVVRTNINMGGETLLPFNVLTSATGTLFDKGGPNNDYTVPETNLEALIAPCGAQSVTLDFTMFKLLANANLKIYDGVDATGVPLHSGNGFTLGNVPTSITANSGAMYLLWNSTTGATDSGFAANWTSVAGNGAAPVAQFDLPGATLYNSVFVDFYNQSLNAEGNSTFLWTIAGPGGVSTSVNKDLLNLVFTTNGTYTATLVVTACDTTIKSTMIKTFVVADPTTPTELDFTASTNRPAIGDEVVFTATSDKANRWEWTFYPSVGWSAVAPTAENQKERTFTFNVPGTYTAQLRGFNTIDTAASEATVVKTAYIIVVDHCVPVIGLNTSTDVGISSVKITDVNSSDVLLENTSLAGTGTTSEGYSDYSDLGTINLNYGGTYAVEVKRSSNVNAMTRKIWVDWNVDGDFTDAGELVATEPAGKTASWTANIPVPSAAFPSATRMRVGVSYQNDLNMPCGANSNPSANRIGEFEDYIIEVVNDGDIPVITLIGDETVYVQRSNTPSYSSAGATAIDPSQGDISANLMMTTDLDESLAGVYYEQWNVLDASGNAADEVVRVIYVVADQNPPTIDVIGLTDTTIEVGTAWIDLGATAFDNEENLDLTNAIVTSGAVNFNLLGDYTITYAVQDNQANASTATRIVRVVDRQLPVIENTSADKSGACWLVEVQLRNIFADITSVSDNYNSIGSGLTFTASPAAAQGGAAVDTRFQGTTSVTYTATDESGNTTTQCIDYVVKDYVAPVISLGTPDVVTHRVNTPYTPVAATATDNLYSGSQISITGTSDVKDYALGTYFDTYTATDAAGNVSTKVRTVHVIDDVSPKITGKNGGILKVGVGSQVNAIDYINFSDNYDAPSVMRNNHRLVYNDINLDVAGTYSAIFVTEDNSGNLSDEYTLRVDVSHNYAQKTNSIEDLSIEDMLSVSPNPTTGLVNINVNLPENEEINIAVYNTMGQEVVNVKNGKVSNGNYTVSLDNQTNGIYYVQMSLKGAIVTKKVLLNK